VDAAALLSSQPVPRGERVAVITNAGGLGILCADACESAGLQLPTLAPETQEALRAVLPIEASVTNPVDMLGSATAAVYRATVPPVVADPGVDAVIVLFVPPVAVDEGEVGAAISQGAAEAGGEKPVLCSFVSSRGAPASLRTAARVPAFAYPEAAARALGRAAERSRWLRRPAGTIPALEVDRTAAEAVVAEALDDVDERWLDPPATRRLLDAYGVPLVPERLATSEEEAVAAATDLGFPSVVKSGTPGAHKTETGGVALDLADADAVREAAARIGPPVIVQPLITGGAELLAGVVQDPVFGPLVAFGAGGVMAELIGQASFRLAPLTDLDVEELVTTGKAGRLVAGFRGRPAADAKALGDLLLRLSRLADDLPEVAELDLNPVMALPDRCVAVDARVRIVRQAPAARAKTW
jgi:acyl-CoA synthetase (NDP forming)